jgi:hypothetical protein
MWMMVSQAERCRWEGERCARAEEVREIFLDFDPICPPSHWVMARGAGTGASVLLKQVCEVRQRIGS